MANLDLSDILDDPEFADTCVIIKRTRSTINGRVSQVEERHKMTAVIQPASAEDITMLSPTVGGGFLGEVLSVWSKKPLSLGGTDRAGDLVEFKGARYSVASAEDYYANGRYYKTLIVRMSDV